MKVALEIKLQAMLWDIPECRRREVANRILINASEAFRNDEQLFVKALSSLKWYELAKLIGYQNLPGLLTDSAIKKLYPVQRRNFYTNARRLLSKYTLWIR
jgi:hypothetical protein